MIEKVGDPDLAVHAIWTPILPSDRAVTAAALRTLTDPRVRHWWDGDRYAQEAFRPLLGLPAGKPAWDVYLVYPRAGRWPSKGPPAPTFHQHQLRELPPEHLLDGRVLRREIERRLGERR